MTHKTFARAVVCAVVLAVAVRLPAAASFGFNPITLTLDPRSPVGTFTITNNESIGKIIQVELNRWEQHGGKDTLTKSTDLIVSPPVFTMGPNERQIIRVGTRTRTGQSAEKAYRIVVSEAPILNSARVGMSVAMRVNVPIFVAATTEDPKKPDWRVIPLDAKHVTVTVDNVSSAHIHVMSLALEQRKTAVGTLRDGSYILAGERHEWTVELMRPIQPGPISVNVTSDLGILKFSTTAQP